MTEKRQYKVWKAKADSTAGMMVTDKSAFLIGNDKNFVAANNIGVQIVGKSIALGTITENLRRAGLFVGMNDFLRLIPSTIVTPQPMNVPSPPLGLVKGIKDDLAFFFAMLA